MSLKQLSSHVLRESTLISGDVSIVSMYTGCNRASVENENADSFLFSAVQIICHAKCFLKFYVRHYNTSL